MLDDKRLIRRFNQGDKSALREIYGQYKHELVSLGTVLLNDKETAEDIVHDVFVKLVERQLTLRISDNLKRYLITSVVNGVRQKFRNQKKQQHRDHVIQSDQNCIQEKTHEPVTVTLTVEKKQRIALALMSVPYEQREVILLRHFSDLTFRSIAQLQNSSINTVQGRYRYGIVKLRHLLNGDLL